MDDEPCSCSPSPRWPGLYLQLHSASTSPEPVELTWAQSPFSSSSLPPFTPPEKVPCHSLTLPKYSLCLIVVRISYSSRYSYQRLTLYNRGWHVLGCRNLPRLGCGALDYIPPNAPCHDPDRCIRLLRVSSSLTNLVSIQSLISAQWPQRDRPGYDLPVGSRD